MLFEHPLLSNLMKVPGQTETDRGSEREREKRGSGVKLFSELKVLLEKNNQLATHIPTIHICYIAHIVHIYC